MIKLLIQVVLHYYCSISREKLNTPSTREHPTVDNPKMAARHFLNALDRVSRLKEQYEKNLSELNNDITVFQNFITRPFGKDEELKALKLEIQKLEREISLKIQNEKKKAQLRLLLSVLSKKQQACCREKITKETRKGCESKNRFLLQIQTGS